jgi:uncharacterized protein (TIGR02145 family)
MEWDDLEKSAGGKKAGKALKSSSGWNDNGNGTDAYGFSALPGGFCFSGVVFGNAGDSGEWWTVTEKDSDGAYYQIMYYYDDDVHSGSHANKSDGRSIRCVKD